MRESTQVLLCLVTYHRSQTLEEGLRHFQRIAIPASCRLSIRVYDNSEDPIEAQKISELCGSYGMAYRHLTPNLGVSGAYQKACAEAIGERFDFVWFWDQDSRPAENSLTLLLDSFRSLHAKEPRLALVAPSLQDSSGQDEHWYFDAPAYDLGSMRTHRRSMRTMTEAFAWTTFFVNSGALISADAIRAVGPPSTDYFMDLVDFEYSSRLTRLGWKMAVVSEAKVEHQVGFPERRKFLWREVWARHYPPLRYYYQAKNEMLLARDSERFLTLGLKAQFRLLLRPIKIFYDHDRFFLKLRAHLQGWWDGLRNKRGKTHPPWVG